MFAEQTYLFMFFECDIALANYKKLDLSICEIFAQLQTNQRNFKLGSLPVNRSEHDNAYFYSGRKSLAIQSDADFYLLGVKVYNENGLAFSQQTVSAGSKQLYVDESSWSGHWTDIYFERPLKVLGSVAHQISLQLHTPSHCWCYRSTNDRHLGSIRIGADASELHISYLDNRDFCNKFSIESLLIL